jgi:hypothetical protein
MKRLAVAITLVLLLVSSASAYGNAVTQSITMSSGGGQISQSAANAAVVKGNNNYISQDVSQTARGSQITQSGANAVVVVGNNNYVNQDVSQTARGSQITQSGANALAVLGDNNYADQQVTQMAYGQNIFQNGWNTGSITGNGNTLVQGLLSYAQTYINPADPSQTMSNTAYITGSYNQVNQEIEGRVLMGGGNDPVSQTASNFVRGVDPNHNRFDQRMKIKTRVGPRAEVSQYGSNEVRIGQV